MSIFLYVQVDDKTNEQGPSVHTLGTSLYGRDLSHPLTNAVFLWHTEKYYIGTVLCSITCGIHQK